MEASGRGGATDRQPSAVVRYWWTHDGDEERCEAERVAAPVGSACDYCGAPFAEGDGDAIRLTCMGDGQISLVHERCAIEGTDAADAARIASLPRR